MIQNAVVEIAGYEVIISASDYERVMAYKWRKAGIKRGTYFRRSYYDKEAGKKKEMFLHRFLANCQHGKQIVDHISGNTLDNRQENLRNTLNNHFVEINGVTKTIGEWAEISGIRAGTILQRIKLGWLGNKILMPSREKKQTARGNPGL
jgi:hypothetical protein